MTDPSNDKINNNQTDSNLPEWLSQFRKELNASKSQDENADKTNFKNADAIMMPLDSKHFAAGDYHPFAFLDLAGYKEAISSLKKIGVGNNNERVNDGIITALNRFHGVTSRPALRPILIEGETPEEIEPLIQATIDEFGMPTVRLQLQETMNGLPAMSVTANKSALTNTKNKSPLTWISENNGLLIIENVEDWTMFFDEPDEDSMNPFLPIKLTPTGSELISLVAKSIDNPQVQILCTTNDEGYIPGEMWDMLGQVNKIKVDRPTKAERLEVWNKLSSKHPSLRGLSNSELSELTENLSRHELEVIAQDAVSEAYQSGLQKGACRQVTRENVFEKIILRQDPKSPEFKRLEEALVSSFALSFNI